MKRITNKLVHLDLVRPSHSLYSSPLLVVKKRMDLDSFVSIIALSPITLEASFPISNVDELLDE